MVFYVLSAVEAVVCCVLVMQLSAKTGNSASWRHGHLILCEILAELRQVIRSHHKGENNKWKLVK